MKRIYIYLISAMTLAACHSNRDITYSPVSDEEPTYKLDQRVEKFRKESGVNMTTNNSSALGDGTGSSYASYGSRQGILNTMGKQAEAPKTNGEKNISNTNASSPMTFYDIPVDTTSGQ